jgi:hypothetical protein
MKKGERIAVPPFQRSEYALFSSGDRADPKETEAQE